MACQQDYGCGKVVFVSEPGFQVFSTVGGVRYSKRTVDCAMFDEEFMAM